MTYIRVQLTHSDSREGEQWITHTFRETERNEMLKSIRSWQSRNVPFKFVDMHGKSCKTSTHLV